MSIETALWLELNTDHSENQPQRDVVISNLVGKELNEEAFTFMQDRLLYSFCTKIYGMRGSTDTYTIDIQPEHITCLHTIEQKIPTYDMPDYTDMHVLERNAKGQILSYVHTRNGESICTITRPYAALMQYRRLVPSFVKKKHAVMPAKDLEKFPYDQMAVHTPEEKSSQYCISPGQSTFIQYIQSRKNMVLRDFVDKYYKTDSDHLMDMKPGKPLPGQKETQHFGIAYPFH